MNPPSRTPSILEEGSTTPLPAPVPPFLQRRSVASNIGTVPTDSGAGSFVLRSDSPSPLAPSKDEPSNAQDDEFEGAFHRKPVFALNHRARLIFAVLAGLLVILAIVLGVYFGAVHHHKSRTSSTSAQPSGPKQSAPSSTPTSVPGEVIYGGDGTVVTTEQGTTFVYNNSFGGYFVFDPNDPFNNNAQAQSYTPPLNQSWDFSSNQIFGVNLGGWLVMEPFITPSYFQKYTTAVDEWTLSVAMANDAASGGLSQLEQHYQTFITEEDFAQIAGAGLNWIRLPIPFWAIDTWEGEPFLAKTCWKYALKAFDWARKYGLRIMLDLHATPGSQNGYNHSGQVGIVNLLNGVMGFANAQRLLHYIRIFTEFISQPEYRDVVVMFGIVNEPAGVPTDALNHFYIQAYDIIRNITGVGAGNGPYISLQGGGDSPPFFPGADRIAIEQHPYFAFDGMGSSDVVPYITQPCASFSSLMVDTQNTIGVATGAEWSLGFNDCGLLLVDAGDDHSTSAAVCTLWNEWENYTQTMKDNLKSFAMASMDGLHHWFFWTWKIGPSAIDNMPRSPLWSYKLGLDNGWMPTDPRQANGHCSQIGVPAETFSGTFLPYQTGGPGAGSIDASIIASYGAWPPPSIGLVPPADVSLLPTYTATGPIPTLPTETYPSPTYTLPPNFDGGDGWFDAADTTPGMSTVAGCTYPNAWDATAAAIPLAACTGA